MAITAPELPPPSDPEAVADILMRHGEREEQNANIRILMWRLAYLYLQGYRRFKDISVLTGTVRAFYLSETGEMEFQEQHLLRSIDRSAGMAASTDLRPKVEATSTTLEAVRHRAMGQVLLNAIIPENHLDELKTKLMFTLYSLGSVGLTGHTIDHPAMGLTTDLEIVHPSELAPWPSLGMDYTKQAGLMRTRYVSANHLKQRFGRTWASRKAKAQMWKIAPGSAVDTISTQNNQALTEGGDTEIVKIRELWIDGPCGTISRYVISSGKSILLDQDYTGMEEYCPVAFERLIENGTFHGMGLFDLLYGISRQAERLLHRVFQNVHDLDQYGALVIPRGSFNVRKDMAHLGKGLRLIDYEPDTISEASNFRPFPIAPANTSDLPARVVGVAQQVFADLDPHKDLADEKGRIDSARGLQVLDEQIQRAQSTQTRATQGLFAKAYRSIASRAAVMAAASQRAIPVSEITLDLAGVVLGPDDTVSFAFNPVPNPSRLSFTVQETSPRSKVARKQESLEMVQLSASLGGGGWDDFVTFAMKEGLDFAMDLSEWKGPYEVVVRNIITLYGDGRTPGEITLTPSTVKADYQRKILKSFMASLRMAQASPEVQDAFTDYDETLAQWTTGILPEGVPNPTDLLDPAQEGTLQA